MNLVGRNVSTFLMLVILTLLGLNSQVSQDYSPFYHNFDVSQNISSVFQKAMVYKLNLLSLLSFFTFAAVFIVSLFCFQF